MPLRRKAYPIGVVIEVDQADGRFQVGKKRRREVVIVTGANEENFRARIGWQGSFRQASGEALPGFFRWTTGAASGPGLGARVLHVYARGPAAGQTPGNRRLTGKSAPTTQKPPCRRWLRRALAMKQPGDSQLYALINQVIIGIATMSISTAPHSGTMMKALYENTL